MAGAPLSAPSISSKWFFAASSNQVTSCNTTDCSAPHNSNILTSGTGNSDKTPARFICALASSPTLRRKSVQRAVAPGHRPVLQVAEP
eukprot:1619274-Amphidinium_carterae.1